MEENVYLHLKKDVKGNGLNMGHYDICKVYTAKSSNEVDECRIRNCPFKENSKVRKNKRKLRVSDDSADGTHDDWWLEQQKKKKKENKTKQRVKYKCIYAKVNSFSKASGQPFWEVELERGNKWFSVRTDNKSIGDKFKEGHYYNIHFDEIPGNKK